MSEKKQSILEGLIIMAYNVGRDHGANTSKMTLEIGRAKTLEMLLSIVDSIDPGDLARPIEGLFK